jgi:hypothetical protein
MAVGGPPLNALQPEFPSTRRVPARRAFFSQLQTFSLPRGFPSGFPSKHCSVTTPGRHRARKFWTMAMKARISEEPARRPSFDSVWPTRAVARMLDSEHGHVQLDTSPQEWSSVWIMAHACFAVFQVVRSATRYTQGLGNARECRQTPRRFDEKNSRPWPS